jgi:hypothetical protein
MRIISYEAAHWNGPAHGDQTILEETQEWGKGREANGQAVAEMDLLAQ